MSALDRLLSVAEWLDRIDCPTQAAALREAHADLRDRARHADPAGAEWEAYEAWLGGREDVR